MTYRERRLARAERLREWADKRTARADAAFDRAHAIADGIPFGQPILVGHHSEGRARRDAARIDSGIRAGFEHTAKAASMASRADNIERAAAHAIYSDDEDAIPRLAAKIAKLEATRDARKAANATWRTEHRAELRTMTAYQRDQAQPFPGYAITNLTGNIGRLRARLEQLRRAARP